MKMPIQDDFRESLLGYFDKLRERVATENGDWTVKGFIDVYKRIYTISLDTKVLSKVLELVMFPVIQQFAHERDYELVLARQQNQYPDITLISRSQGTRYAIDIKTTYRKGRDKSGDIRVNGMTLGTYMGYFRARESSSIITFPYNTYAKHYVLGVIYTQVADTDEMQIYDIAALDDIPSVATDFDFFLHEKYRIAADRPGSGNTKNIGSTVHLDRLIEGTGVFSPLGVEIFDDYWMNYRTKEMARAEGFKEPPYSNLIQYRDFKKRGAGIVDVPEEQIQSEANESDIAPEEEEENGDIEE